VVAPGGGSAGGVMMRVWGADVGCLGGFSGRATHLSQGFTHLTSVSVDCYVCYVPTGAGP
jgi:hypothetical protein